MSKRHAREHGRILSVDEETLGSVLVADAALGATTLTVDDAAEFEDDGTGGWLSINDQVIEYDTVDDDAGTIHLKTGLTAAADDGDPVYVWSKLYDTAATVKTALVMVDGEDDNTDPIHATLADAVQDLPEGLRGGSDGESCTLVRVSDDEWEITAVGGQPSSAKGAKAVQFDEEAITVEMTGAQTMRLSHTPIDHSEHLYWNGLYQPADQWSRDGQVVTIPDSAGNLRVNGTLTMEYAYRIGLRQKLSVPIGATWKYQAGGTENDTAKAAPGYDDSTWSSGPSGFGYPGTLPNVGTAVPRAGTTWSTWTRLQARSYGGDLAFTVNADWKAWVWVDGTLVWSGASGAFSFTVPASAGVHTIAAYGWDGGNPWPPDGGSVLAVEIQEA